MRYRLTAGLEGGTLAELFSGLADERTPVLVKLFFPHTSDREYALEAARVGHAVNALAVPGLVRVREIGTVAGRLAVVRDLVEGVSLAQLLHRMSRREVTVSAPLCLAVGIELLELVQRAHAGGVVHGSLTPGNLFVTATGSVAICDFAALEAVRNTPSLARLFATGGRTAYRAPEVLLGDPPTETSDVYSLAAVAYELLTLREPRASGGDPRRATVVPPSRIDPRLAPRLDEVLGRALDPDPDRRPQSCAALASALRELLPPQTAGSAIDAAERERLTQHVPPVPPLLPLPFAEPFELENGVPVDSTLPASDPPRRPRSVHPDGNPDDDATDPEPTQAEPWEAPPGRMRGLGRRILARAVPKRPGRMRWVRDFGGADEAAHTDPPSAAVIPVRFPSRGAGPADLRRRPDRRTRPSGPVRPARALVAGALLLGAAGLLASGVWLGRTGRMDALLAPAPKPTPPDAPLLAPVHESPEEPAGDADLGWDTPPPVRLAAFLSISTDLPARVYVDGRLVRRPTPLERYPVRPGTHAIVLEAIDSVQRREVTVTATRGKVSVVRQLFDR